MASWGVTTVLSVPQLGFPRDEVQEMTQALAPSGPRARAGHEEDFSGMKRKAVIQSGSSRPPARPLHPKAGGQAAVPGGQLAQLGLRRPRRPGCHGLGYRI